MAQANYIDNSNYQTPNPVGQINQMQAPSQPNHNFDGMYAGPNNPLVGAASPMQNHLNQWQLILSVVELLALLFKKN